MEYNKNKAKGYTLPYDTPYQQHMKKVKEITSSVSPVFFFRARCQKFKNNTNISSFILIHLTAEVQRSV